MGTTTSATVEEKRFKTAFTTVAVVRMENGEFALTRVVYTLRRQTSACWL